MNLEIPTAVEKLKLRFLHEMAEPLQATKNATMLAKKIPNRGSSSLLVLTALYISNRE